MAFTCVQNYFGGHACTKYNTNLCYSGQQNNVPTITAYCVSKLYSQQLLFESLLEENDHV